MTTLTRRILRFRPTANTMIASGLSLTVASGVFAQGGSSDAPELNTGLNLGLAYGVMFILTVVVLVTAFWPSKRGHQD